MSSEKSTEPRILVIDDNDTARTLMTQILREASFTVHEQGTPIGATRLILRENIVVVVVDVNMPAMQGDKLVSLFRANPKFAGVGLVLVSSEPEEYLEQLGRRSGADATVQKNLVATELVETVRRLSTQPPPG